MTPRGSVRVAIVTDAPRDAGEGITPVPGSADRQDAALRSLEGLVWWTAIRIQPPGAETAAMDKVPHDTAVDLAPQGVSVVSLPTRLLRTERRECAMAECVESRRYAAPVRHSRLAQKPGRAFMVLADRALLRRSRKAPSDPARCCSSLAK